MQRLCLMIVNARLIFAMEACKMGISAVKMIHRGQKARAYKQNISEFRIAASYDIEFITILRHYRLHLFKIPHEY